MGGFVAQMAAQLANALRWSAASSGIKPNDSACEQNDTVSECNTDTARNGANGGRGTRESVPTRLGVKSIWPKLSKQR
eukprot:1158478-Amphidinium_carterae.1